MALDDESGGSNVVDVDFGRGAEGKAKVAKDANLTEQILAEIRKEPRTVEQLAVACSCTEKQVRNAVTALRRKYQSDNGDHVVSYKRSYWTAAELERRGFTLQATEKGTLKVQSSPATAKKKPKGGGKKKDKPTKDEIAAKVLEELGDSPDAQRVARLIVAKYDAFLEAENDLPRQRTKARDMKKAAEAAFKETIEQGIETGDDAAALQKLHAVEQSWQNKLEREAEAVEIRKHALEKRNKARDAFSGVMENIRQLELFADVA